MSSLHDPTLRRDLARAALSLASSGSWREATLVKLADAASRPAADFYGASLGEAIDCVEEAFDRAIAENLDQLAPDQSVRDRLFELIMRRFEAMEPYRAAVLAMEQGQDRDPTLLAAAHQRHVRCARWVLALAGLEADGMTGNARAQGLGVIIGQARAAWRGDTAGDFAKTMASLDKNLRRAEEMFGRWAGFEAKPKPGETGGAA
ncbi:MAG: hypothetical protein KJZ75_02000 [Hyphomonadaceae bacterium]|nr:hypothetical protein [Hyphomonadaceae bacterium]GIK49965.1 MAG: hypothetical protein BroJett013_26620 [Alphaproteobacteria bacterium]